MQLRKGERGLQARWSRHPAGDPRACCSPRAGDASTHHPQPAGCWLPRPGWPRSPSLNCIAPSWNGGEEETRKEKRSRNIPKGSSAICRNRLRLAPRGGLLNAEDDKLRRSQRRKPDFDLDDAGADVRRRCRLPSALHEIRFARRRALKRALAEQPVEELADRQPQPRPKRFIVWLEDRPLRAPSHAFLDEQRRPAHGDVFEVRCALVIARPTPQNRNWETSGGN